MTVFRPTRQRDHGGGIDAAAAHYGGARADWLDLSTGINPIPYPLPTFVPSDWTDLPDSAAQTRLIRAARRFWQIPEQASIVAAPGLSAAIVRLPALRPADYVQINTPTYNEHAAAFRAQGWIVTEEPADMRVIVHPNNPDGRHWTARDLARDLSIIDESFCDTMPERSLIASCKRHIVLKSFGKFWGLAGLRLGFVIGPADLIKLLADAMGPWPVSGPALRAGAEALEDTAWADETRARLTQDAARLDRMVTARGARLRGGTPLFRLYHVEDAAEWQDRLAEAHIWTRIFPYSDHLIRFGLPHPDAFERLEDAL